MKALLLIAHGSKRQPSNQEVEKLSLKINDLLEGKFNIVQAGFLELAQPLIPEAIDKCVALGATDITIVPYFLSAGRHVVQDIPKEVEKGQKNNPETLIKISNYLGARDEIASLLIKSAVEA